MKRPFRLVAFLLCLVAPAHADLDLDANGLGDVWEAKFRPAILLPAEDSDSDGRTNLEECQAGTDPLRAEDIFAIGNIAAEGSNLRLKWPSQAGKHYQIQTTATPDTPSSWLSLPGQETGTGGDLEVVTPRPATAKAFFRVIAADVDTDNDGLTDWEELQVGYDPTMDHTTTCGCGDNCGCTDCACGGTDLERLTAALQGTSTVSISAVDAEATEPAPLGANAATPATDTGTFRIKRRGGIARITVNLASAGTAGSSDYQALPVTLTLPLSVKEVIVTLTPVPDAVAESDEVVTMSVNTGTGYVLGATTSADVIIHDYVQANGTGLAAEYRKYTSTTLPADYFASVPVITRVDPTVNFDNAVATWPGPPIVVGTAANFFSSRWTGEVLPEFSQAYTFYTNNSDAGRLWVNGQLIINNWPPATTTTSEVSAVISLEGGKRYPIVFEHYNNSGGFRSILSWQSQSQAKQVIPQLRLFPNMPPKILPPFEVLAFVGAPTFQYQINASGTPTSYAASNLPPGLSINAATGLISGDPTTAGEWKVTLTASNANGSGSAFLDLTIIQAGGGITRELWTGIPGNNVSQIPLTTAPASTSVLGSLKAPSDEADNYGVRIRGFVTAPATGEYRFFLRADESAEFYLSDDEEPVNAWKRTELTGPVAATDWTAAARSPLLHLEAGSRYYLEIRHKEGSGSDHLAVAWLTPGDTRTVPADTDMVPGHLLTRFEDVALGSSTDGTLYFASLTPQTGAVTNAYGSGTLRLSADKTTAWVTPNFSGLGSAFFAMHVHDDRLPPTSNIVFDLDEPGVEMLADGSYVWHIEDVGTLTAAQIGEGIAQHAYLNIHSVDYPNGEIKGFFRALDGSSTFTAPPAPPNWTAEPAAANSNVNAASRFLQQATFGASDPGINALIGKASYDQWIDEEFIKPVTTHLPYVEKFRTVSDPNTPVYPGTLTFNSWWKNSIQGDDQLRQRVAFALSEIMVVSENGPLDDRANALSDYYDTLLANAFGNARDLLEAVTLHPAMGRYLDMLRNDQPSITAGRIPNENYAREILQLFSLGLYRQHPDGSLILNSKGVPIPVYDQDEVIGFAHVFTGWDYNYSGAFHTSLNASSNWIEPMREVPARHFTGKKRLLNNVVLPGLPTLNGVPLDPYGSHSGATIANDPVFQALARQELAAVHDQIFQHPNFGPFLCRQLIQRLVTSTPSRGYIYRVVSKFNNNGSGVRGDMKAVVKAILLDYEARSLVAANAPGYGKQREPVMRVTQLARAFPPANNFAGSYVQDGGLISINTDPFVHRLAVNQPVLLGFTGSPVPATDGTYAVSSTYVPTSSAFTVRTKDIFRATWAQSGNVITVTTPSAHGFTATKPVYLRFRTGAAGVIVNGGYAIAAAPTTTSFTIPAPDSATRSGDCDVAWLRGSYSQSYTGGVTTLTITCTTLPGLDVGDKLNLSFVPVTGQTTLPPDGTYTIATVNETEPRRFTLTPDSGVQSILDGRSGTFMAAPLTPELDRSGSVTAGYSDWGVNSTDTDLGQTPLRSPTVFNFFEPDYQFPGTLASNGLITPEFQISSDTNVIRQANFLFGGIYSHATSTTSSSTYTNGLNSFRAGAQDVMMDFSPWMAARTTGTDYWTNTANLRDLIKQFSRILMAGQMSSGMEDQIYSFVSNTTNIPYAATPSEAERRNRVRAILHLIAVSPELVIQR